MTEQQPDAALAGTVELLTRFVELKRVRVAGAQASITADRFCRAWAALAAGQPVRDVAVRESAALLCTTQLSGIDAHVLRRGGLGQPRIEEILHAALERVLPSVNSTLHESLRASVAALSSANREPALADAPAFARRLAEQPRAGATHRTAPRLVLSPAENHADHCFVVAVTAVLLSPQYGASLEAPFLAGLAHHLHNALLPDGGFAGEELLGPDLAQLVTRFVEQGLAELPEPLAATARDATQLTTHVETADARAFQAADVLDRVAEMAHFDRVARFTTRQALDEQELVHAGPLQTFQKDLLAHAGLM